MERRLAEFQLIKSLGQGALGKVYLAEHAFMKKQFALKILPEDLASDRHFVQRFEQDISQLAQLDHPSIARIHQVSFADGCYFIVTDLAVGPEGEPVNLQQYLNARKHVLSEEEIFQILSQLAGALDYAHSRMRTDSQPLSHLSLRPSNILVTGKPTQLRFMLTDFGLHRIVGCGRVLNYLMGGLSKEMLEGTLPPQLESTDQGHDHMVAEYRRQSFHRAFHFLAPEQKRADHEQGSACDVYSFGVLAYYLLVGDIPEGVFELPSLVRDDLEYNWDRMIMSCLNARPQRRPKSLGTLLEAVQSSASYEAPQPVPPVQPAAQTVVSMQPSHVMQPMSQAIAMPPSGSSITNDFSSFDKSSNVASKLVVSSGAQAYQRALEQQQMDVPPLAAQVLSTSAKPAMGLEAASAAASFPAGQAAVVSNPNRPGLPGSQSQTAPGFPPKASTTVAGLSSSSVIIKNNPALNTVSHVYVGAPAVRTVQQDTGTEVEPLSTPMRTIQGGRYMRGSNDGSRDEMPRHAVVVADFSIDIHPVTNEQFVRFLRAIGTEKDESNNDIIRLKESRIKRVGGKLLIEPGYHRHPVVGVTWYGALAYCKWVGKRLPTEAEWEIASRGGIEDVLYPTGDNIEKTQANFFNNDTTAVMSYPPNGYEVYDMAGNVYEWCQDWYAYNTYELTVSEPMMPKGPLQGVYRVLRGGCWKSLKEDLRCAHRHRNNPGAVNRTYGFRCACDVSTQSGATQEKLSTPVTPVNLFHLDSGGEN